MADSNPSYPSSLPKPITKEEEAELRDCFPWNLYYLQNIDYLPQAILCRGKLTTIPEEAYKKVKANIERVFGDRFVLIFQEGTKGRPFFALVPNPWKDRDSITQESHQWWVALGLLGITLFTTTISGCLQAGIEMDAIQRNSELLIHGLSYSVPLMLILVSYEGSYYLTALRHKLAPSIPYLIPEPFFLVGTLGAFRKLNGAVGDRKTLFDIDIISLGAGLAVTIITLAWGLSLSTVVNPEDTSQLLNIDNLNPRFSFFLALISKLSLGSALVAKNNIDLHPMAVAGYLGFLFIAFNLIPVGQLPGGKIIHAMLGQTVAGIVGSWVKILIIVLAAIQQDFLFWMVAISLIFTPTFNQPTLNDVTELDDRRDLIGLGFLVLLVTMVLPLPGLVATWLNF
ncbi:MAG: site-2 protease family protein [Synechococcaceae cyanobacterium RL_1_2]|nr:site-2 protease family protein [Synechococcaceae cyanobacterium RL_1_2]